MCKYIYLQTYVCIFTYVCIYVYMYTHIHMCVYIYIYSIHTYVCIYKINLELLIYNMFSIKSLSHIIALQINC